MHILVVIQANCFFAFEIQNTNSQPLPLKDGELALPLSQLECISDLFMEYANVRNMDDFEFDVVNASGKTDCIKTLVSCLLPCESFQVRSIENVLPELILKKNIMNDESTKQLTFDHRNYEVTVDEYGIWKTSSCETEGDALGVEDFVSLCTEGFSINKAKLAKIDELEQRITFLEKDNESIRRELAYKESKIRNLERKRVEEETAKQIAQQVAQKKKEDKNKIRQGRVEVRLTQAMISNMNGSGTRCYKEPIVYLKSDKATVKKYDPLLQNGEGTFDVNNAQKEYVILAERDGVFYKGCDWISKGSYGSVETSRRWHADDLVGIIADPKDDEAEIRKYMEEVMREEAMKDFI
ncbi:MAG: hypothetical protein ACI38O_11645 [Fibrobacter intestinalis]|uniref:hypothetical protein n=1 Tax=Fibrobacter intestinalis TaxID=28122 RepID=UPI003F060243